MKSAGDGHIFSKSKVKYGVLLDFNVLSMYYIKVIFTYARSWLFIRNLSVWFLPEWLQFAQKGLLKFVNI